MQINNVFNTHRLTARTYDNIYHTLQINSTIPYTPLLMSVCQTDSEFCRLINETITRKTPQNITQF